MILYFSGTGNSKYVAKRIADALGDALVNLNDRIKASDTSLVETGVNFNQKLISGFLFMKNTMCTLSDAYTDSR